MNLTRCNEGHFYDADNHRLCPHCIPENTIGTPTKSTVEIISQNDVDFVDEYKKSQPYYSTLAEFESCKDTNEPFLFISYAHSDAEKIKPF